MTEEPAMAYRLCRFLDAQDVFKGPLNRLQRRLLAFYIGEQDKRTGSKEETDFKSLFFALVHRDNHDLYAEVFKSEEERQREEAENDYGYDTPQSEADLQRMYREMKRAGLLQYSDGTPVGANPT